MAAPIMVRAEITKEQWNDLRKLALDLATPVQKIVGEAITDRLAKSNGPVAQANST